MVAAVTTPDTKDVSQFLSTPILTGNIELSVSRLYKHVPEIDREAQIHLHQDELNGRVTKQPED